MSLAYPDRAGPLSTCPGKFRSGNFEVVGACSWYGAYNFFHVLPKNLGIKTPKLVLFELGTTADCTAVDLLVHSSTRVRKIGYHLLIPIVIPAGYILRLYRV